MPAPSVAGSPKVRADAANGTSITTTKRVRFALSCAGLVTLLSATPKTLRQFFGRALTTSKLTADSHGKDALQYAFFGLAVYGVSLIYLPAALIFGGLVMVASLEFK